MRRQTRLVAIALILLAVLCFATTVRADDDEEDYYAILELPEREDASEKDIKKMFRKLSKQYHPDVNAGEEARQKYVQVNKAYEVLSDKRKRKIYDMKGVQGLKQLEASQNNPNAGMMDPFMRMFGMGGGGGGVNKGQNQQMTVEVPLSDVYNGASHKLTINKQKLCKRCRGTGAASKDDFTKCSQCKGQGQVVQRIQLAPGFVQQMQQPCPKCSGTGKMIKKKCPTCGGNKVVRGDSVLELEVERGVPEGHSVTFEMESDQSPDVIPGDIVIVLKTKEDPNFVRKGDDLETTMRLTLREALLGFTKSIRHMDGRQVEVSQKGITPFGTRLRIAGEGMPKHNVPSEKGDLFVTLEFDLPQRLSAAQIDGVKRIL